MVNGPSPDDKECDRFLLKFFVFFVGGLAAYELAGVAALAVVLGVVTAGFIAEHYIRLSLARRRRATRWCGADGDPKGPHA